MLNNILNIEGVTVLNKKHLKVLNKKQLKGVNGGQSCTYTIVFAGGGSHSFVGIANYSEGAAGSAEANSICAEYAIESGNRCFYDCEWDD